MKRRTFFGAIAAALSALVIKPPYIKRARAGEFSVMSDGTQGPPCYALEVYMNGVKEEYCVEAVAGPYEDCAGCEIYVNRDQTRWYRGNVEILEIKS